MKGLIVFVILAVFFQSGIYGALNVTCSDRSDNCFDCLLGSCGYCFGGRSGIVQCMNGSVSPPPACDTSDPNQATWVGDAQDCPDSCITSEHTDCQSCLSDSTCVWCNDGGACRSGNSNGPWSPNLDGCTDWRYTTDDNNGTLTAICSMFAPCSQQSNCQECLVDYEAKGKTCVWCNSTTGAGSCISNSANATCPNSTLAWTDSTLCPALPEKNLANAFIPSLLAFLLAFLVSKF